MASLPNRFHLLVAGQSTPIHRFTAGEVDRIPQCAVHLPFNLRHRRIALWRSGWQKKEDSPGCGEMDAVIVTLLSDTILSGLLSGMAGNPPRSSRSCLRSWVS